MPVLRDLADEARLTSLLYYSPIHTRSDGMVTEVRVHGIELLRETKELATGEILILNGTRRRRWGLSRVAGHAVREDRSGEALGIIQKHRSCKYAVVYFIRQSASSGTIKIGTTSSIHDRLSNLQTANSERLELMAITPGSRELERSLHEIFEPEHISGEWYHLSAEIAKVIAACPVDGPAAALQCLGHATHDCADDWMRDETGKRKA